MFKFISKNVAAYKKSVENTAVKNMLNRKIVDALYAPVFRDLPDKSMTKYLFELGNDKSEEERCFNICEALPHVAEFYAKRNPVLSSALFATYSTMDHLRYNVDKKSGFGLGFRPKPIKGLYDRYQAVIAFITVQFADGSPVPWANLLLTDTDEFEEITHKVVNTLEQF